MFKRLKARWNIESNFQILLILIVFALTGTSTLWVKNHVFNFLGIHSGMPYFIRLVLNILIITPIYQVLLLAIGAVFGQFRFFWEFEKKMIQRLSPGKKTNSVRD